MAKQHRTEDDFARDMKERREAGLTRSQDDRETHIKRGQEAWRRHIQKGDATWNDWMAIGDALLIGRQDAVAAAETNHGSRYNSEFDKWLARYHFDDIDKGDRKSGLIEVINNLSAIEAWRATLTRTARLRLSHPSSVLRKWQAGTEVKETLRDSVAILSEDNTKLKREVEELTARLEEVEAARELRAPAVQLLADTLLEATDHVLQLAAQETAWPPELSTRKAARRKKLLGMLRIGLADLRELSTVREDETLDAKMRRRPLRPT